MMNPPLPDLATLRSRLYIPVTELVRRTGLAHTTIMGIERGAKPHLATIQKLAAALGVTPESIAWPGYPLPASAGEEIVASPASAGDPGFLVPGARVWLALREGKVEEMHAFLLRHDQQNTGAQYERDVTLEAVTLYGLQVVLRQGWRRKTVHEGEWHIYSSVRFYPWTNISSVAPDERENPWA